MKLLAAMLLSLLAAELSLADGARLILVAPHTGIKPHEKVTFEIFLYNPSSKPVRAPALENYSIVSAAQDAAGKLSSGGGTQSKGISELLSLQKLEPKSVQHKTITAEMNVRRGDFVEVFVEIGQVQTLRSNSILLFCSNR